MYRYRLKANFSVFRLVWCILRKVPGGSSALYQAYAIGDDSRAGDSVDRSVSGDQLRSSGGGTGVGWCAESARMRSASVGAATAPPRCHGYLPPGAHSSCYVRDIPSNRTRQQRLVFSIFCFPSAVCAAGIGSERRASSCTIIGNRISSMLAMHCVTHNSIIVLFIDWKFLRHMNDIDRLNLDRKSKLLMRVKWSQKYKDLVDKYPMCSIADAEGHGLTCQVQQSCATDFKERKMEY